MRITARRGVLATSIAALTTVAKLLSTTPAQAALPTPDRPFDGPLIPVVPDGDDGALAHRLQP
ncbi:hypothetical protein GCM10011583_71580 [Streptomyces camponoticapitis]|uniref:Uncharacterized protein n=1 Tax=Streptomyces camponoticapitis TaxID=1616125 RepID=A0ABQ2EW82_9ACTN|nr:hypothetical protein GCM10011583_71580 [Streptomyces camponoticapitis]